MDKNTQIEKLKYQYTSEWEKVVSNVSVTNKEVDLPETGLSLVVFLTDVGCQSCLRREIRNLNRFYQKHREVTQIYLMSNNKSYLDQYLVAFPYKVIDPNESILDSEIEFENPLGLLVDKNGKVQQIYRAEVGNKTKTYRFYQRMSSLFNSFKPDS